MGYSKDPDKYPVEFQEVFRRALEDTIEITCDTPQQAISFRHQLHGYRRAVETAQIPGWSKLRRITIQVDKCKLILANNTRLLASMREAIANTQPSDSDLDKYLEDMDKGET